MGINSTNINVWKANNYLSLIHKDKINHDVWRREIQVLAWDKHTNVAELIRERRSQSSTLDNWIYNDHIYKQTMWIKQPQYSLSVFNGSPLFNVWPPCCLSRYPFIGIMWLCTSINENDTKCYHVCFCHFSIGNNQTELFSSHMLTIKTKIDWIH